MTSRLHKRGRLSTCLGPILGQQFPDPARRMGGDAHQHMGKVAHDIHLRDAAAFDQGVDRRCGSSTADAPREEPIPTTYSDRSDRSLTAIMPGAELCRVAPRLVRATGAAVSSDAA